jgi:hypothetical protein
MRVGRERIGAIARRALAICLVSAALAGAAACNAGSQRHPAPLPTGTSFSVSVTTDRAYYGINQPIGVTLQNTSATSYYAADGKSACTIVELQELIKGAWQDEMPCATGQAPTILLIAPHTSVPFTLAPGNARDDPNSWQPGTYRVALVLLTKPDPSGSTVQIFSAAFQVSGS